MTSPHNRKRSRSLSLFAACLVLLLVVTQTRHSTAQTSPCPTELGAARFKPGDTVYLDLDVRLRGTSAGDQVIEGLNRWTNANTSGGNISGVSFNTTTNLNQVPAGGTVLHVSFEPFTDPFGFPDYATVSSFTVVSNTGLDTTDATILFNTNALANPLNSGSGPHYNPQAPGYETVYIKQTEHEVGHGMGLDHPTNPQPGQSVMNRSEVCPNNAPNDACAIKPTNITSCDNGVVNSVYQPDPPPPTPGGGGGGGGTGGGTGGGGSTFCWGDYHYFSTKSGVCTSYYLSVSTWCDDGSTSSSTDFVGEDCNYNQ